MPNYTLVGAAADIDGLFPPTRRGLEPLHPRRRASSTDPGPDRPRPGPAGGEVLDLERAIDGTTWVVAVVNPEVADLVAEGRRWLSPGLRGATVDIGSERTFHRSSQITGARIVEVSITDSPSQRLGPVHVAQVEVGMSRSGLPFAWPDRVRRVYERTHDDIRRTRSAKTIHVRQARTPPPSTPSAGADPTRRPAPSSSEGPPRPRWPARTSSPASSPAPPAPTTGGPTHP